MENCLVHLSGFTRSFTLCRWRIGKVGGEYTTTRAKIFPSARAMSLNDARSSMMCKQNLKEKNRKFRKRLSFTLCTAKSSVAYHKNSSRPRFAASRLLPERPSLPLRPSVPTPSADARAKPRHAQPELGAATSPVTKATSLSASCRRASYSARLVFVPRSPSGRSATPRSPLEAFRMPAANALWVRSQVF